MARQQQDDFFGTGMLGYDPYAAAAQAQADHAATMASLTERTGPQTQTPGYQPRRGGPRMPQTQPSAPPPQPAPVGPYGGVKMDYGNGTIEYNDGTVTYSNSAGGPVHTRRNADGSVSYNLDRPEGSWTAATNTTGEQPRNAQGQAQADFPPSFNNWSGWDLGKLNNLNHNTVKYQAGRLFQMLSGGGQNTANDFRGRLQEVADEYNRRYGGNAQAVGDDKIDFGDGAGPVDVITSWGDWWWGNEGGGTGSTGMDIYNPYSQYASSGYGDILDTIMSYINQAQGAYNPVGDAARSREFTTGNQPGRVNPMSASDYAGMASFLRSAMAEGRPGGLLPTSYGNRVGPLSMGAYNEAPLEAGGISRDTGPQTCQRATPIPGRANQQRAAANEPGAGAQPGPQIPADLADLRNLLSSIFMGQIGSDSPSYPGSFGIDNPMLRAAGMMAGSAPGAVGNALGPAFGAMGMSLPYALDIARTGGAPMQQLISSLGDIRTAGQAAMTNNLAQIREQYGAMGTGGGADVNAALARGVAETEAATQAQQSSLLTSVLQNAAQTQLGGVNALLGAGSGFGQLAGVLGSAYGQSGQTLAGLAGIQGQQNQFSTQMQYQDWLRRVNPSPWLQSAMGYAMGFPPVMQPQYQGPSTGATLGGAAIAAGGSALAAALPWIIMAASDRELKEDISPAPDVLPALLSLPISTWRYKGDGVRHLGPMAQDFSEAFDIGDGHNIHLVDVMGVTLKALSEIGS